MKTLKQLEKDAILESLARHNDDVQKVAVELGCSPRKVQYRLKQWGMARPPGQRLKQPDQGSRIV